MTLLNPDHTKDVLDYVRAERNRQDEKWGAGNHHQPFPWIAILGEEFGEVCTEALKFNFESQGNEYGPHSVANLNHLREELVQVAAVAVRAVESLENHYCVALSTDNCATLSEEDSYNEWEIAS